MRHTYDRRQGNSWMGHQHFFKLAWIDVIASAENHIFLTIYDIEVAILIHGSDIAGMEPASTHRLGARFGPVVVAFHNTVATHYNLARLSLCHRPVAIVDQPHLGGKERSPDRSRFTLEAKLIEADDGRCL